MPRKPRQKSATGIYHVTSRGNDRLFIFSNTAQKAKLLEIISKVTSESNATVFGYCIMSNHLHLVIKEQDDPISKIMHRIKKNYSTWYNSMNNRINHVFGGPYGSEPIEDDNYLLSVLVYVFLNPVKAKMVKSADDYKWSSYSNLLSNSGSLVNYDALRQLLDIKKLIRYTYSKQQIDDHLEVL